MNITWPGAVALGLLLIVMIRGYSRGFVKEVVSALFMVLSMVFVWMVNPYVSEFLKDNTPVYEFVHENSEDLVQRTLEKTSMSMVGSQQMVLEQLPLPDFLKEKISENNNAETYKYLNVRNYADYISGYIAEIILKGISFLISYLVVSIILHILAGVLDLMTRLPVIKGVNRLAGACLGGIKGIVIIWIIMLILTLLCNTEYGKQGMTLISEDTVLSFLYERNLLIRIFMDLFHGAH